MNRTVFHEPLHGLICVYGAGYIWTTQVSSALKYALATTTACLCLLIGAARATERPLDQEFILDALMFLVGAFCLGVLIRLLVLLFGRQLVVSEERVLYLQDATRTLELFEYCSISDIRIFEKPPSWILLTIAIKDHEQPLRFVMRSSAKIRTDLNLFVLDWKSRRKKVSGTDIDDDIGFR